MKTLFLLRHAKSEWASAEISDHQRALNQRGENEAFLVGEYLKENGIMPDLWLCSTAKRANQTVSAIAKELSKEKSEICFDDELYSFSFLPYLEVLKSCDSVHNSILLVAHNPSLEELSTFLTGDEWRTIQIPTAGLLKFDLAIQKWDELSKGCGELKWIITPETLNR